MLLKCSQIAIELHIILNVLLQEVYPAQFLSGKPTIYGRVSKSIACVALVRKAEESKFS
jgi:hypothetical protein